MKATEKSQEQPFVPTTLEIVIESEAELNEMYARFNASMMSISEGYPFEGKFVGPSLTHDVFNLVENIIRGRSSYES